MELHVSASSAILRFMAHSFNFSVSLYLFANVYIKFEFYGYRVSGVFKNSVSS
jgi:hypothetical protein